MITLIASSQLFSIFFFGTFQASNAYHAWKPVKGGLVFELEFLVLTGVVFAEKANFVFFLTVFTFTSCFRTHHLG